MNDEIDDCDHISRIIEGAGEVGIELTEEEVRLALEQTQLDADEVSLNQPVIDGDDVPKGIYVLYKGGSDSVSGWVSDDPELAGAHGAIKSIVYEHSGQTIDVWSWVNDWDGTPQLVPPGPKLRKVYEGGYLLLANEG